MFAGKNNCRFIALTLSFLCFFVKEGSADSPNSRTLYSGFVEIESISISEIKTRLEAQGCHQQKTDGAMGKCIYVETEIPFTKEQGIEIFPHGEGFGPLSFYLTENKLWANKDIPGKPDIKNFQKEVRQDLKDTGNVVNIKENSWKLTDTKYPWDVLY